ncbi:hypothetical protein V5799_026302 [Amblyomma americanum]|uniref:Peptidase M13 C-terminal domain-containing protein n=1 Tax=Amblyomma americanum TaxID=6943 RepID=A0AAQ4DIZ1_AMBAM
MYPTSGYPSPYETPSSVVPPPALADAKRLGRNIKRTLLNKIRKTRWIRGALWYLMNSKIRALTLVIGYPDAVSSLTMLENFFLEFPDVHENFTAPFLASRRLMTLRHFRKSYQVDWDIIKGNAYYEPNRPAVYVYGNMLQPPAFIPDSPAAVNYGGLGQAESESRARTLDEFIDSEGFVDYAGLQVAYEAFKKLPENERTATVPELGLTADQIFFVSYCLKWCSTAPGTKRSPRSWYWHSRSRCLVPLRNMPEFAEAYNCQRGDRMNPESRCSFW